MYRLTLLFLVLSFALQAQETNKKVFRNIHYQNSNFIDFVKNIEQESGIRIYYRDTELEKLKVNIKSDSIIIDELLQKVVGQNWKISYWEGNYIISQESLISELPEFLLAATELANEEQNKEKYIQTRKTSGNSIISVGKKSNFNVRQKFMLRAKIIDIESNELLQGASLYVSELKTGTVANMDGWAEIYLFPGHYSLEFNFMGYQKREYQLEFNSSGSFTVQMQKSGFELDEISVYGDKMIERSPGVEKLKTQVIRQLPTMLGEVDFLKVAQMLPGIVSVGEGSAGLNVRGGGADQNAFYINHIPIFNTSHLLGFTSAFNPDIVKDFSIYKGFIPLQYGGRLASVFDIDTRQGNKEKFTAHGGISPLAANLVVETPIIKEKLSVILSGRTSYSDWILAKIKDPVIASSHASFYDASAEISYHTEKSNTSVFFYNSFDNFSLSQQTKYEYGNIGVSLNFRKSINKKLRYELSFASSKYKFFTIDNHIDVSAYSQNYDIKQQVLNLQFTHSISQKHELSYGINSNLFLANRGIVKPYSHLSLKQVSNLGKDYGIDNALYFSDKYIVNRWLEITLGMRHALYSSFGRKNIYLYADGVEKSHSSIIDSVSYNKYDLISNQYFPEIRLAISAKTDYNGSIKLAFNQMHQNLFMLNTTVAIAPNAQWKLADYHIKPAQSAQISLGVFRNLPYLKTEFSVEAYFSQTKNFTEYKDGADFLNNPQVETSVLQGNQKAYGIEFMIKKAGKKIDGWISYTYSRSLIHITGPEDWQKINNGNQYPANYDIPHVANGVVNYSLKKRVKFSTIFSYQKGKPFTFPTSLYHIDNFEYIDFSARNAYRIPDYFRIDFSLSIEGNLKKDKFMHSSWVFGLYNATGRDNAYSVFFIMDKLSLNSYQYSIVSVPIFTATWIFKLGNYESL